MNRLTAAALLLLLAGCGGTGGSVPNAVSSGASMAARARLVPVVFTFHVPRKHRGARAPRFISPATKSVGITVDAGGQQTFVAANLTPGSSACTGNTCTLAVNLKPGHHVFDVRTYDKQLSGGVPQGNALSQNLGFPFNVLAGKPNAVGMVLQGVPASIAVAQIPDEDVSGDQQNGFSVYGGFKVDGSTVFPRLFNVAAADADGNYIVGAGAPVLTLTSGNTSIFSNGVASAETPNRFTVTPVDAGGGFIPGLVAFLATATPKGNAGSSPVSASFNMQIAAETAPRIYITDQASGVPLQGRLWVFDEFGNPIPSLQATLDGHNFGGPAGIGYCASVNTLFVAGEFSKTVNEVYADGNLGYALSTTTYQPLGVYCDDVTGHVFIALAGGPVVVFGITGVPAQFPTTGTWHEFSSGQVPSIPWDILVDGNGVTLTDQTTRVIEQYSLNGDAQGESFYSNASEVPFGITDLAGGAQLVTMRDLNLIVGGPVGAGFPNINGPFGIRQDPVNGYIYVVNYIGNTVTRYDAAGNQIPLPPGAFAGLSYPLEMAIVP